MSRLYDVAIEIEEVSEDKSDMVCEVVGKELFDTLADVSFIKDKDGTKGVVCGSSQTTLAGGESEEEAHKRIAEVIKKIEPNAEITTKWHYAEWHDWDQIFTN